MYIDKHKYIVKSWGKLGLLEVIIESSVNIRFVIIEYLIFHVCMCIRNSLRLRLHYDHLYFMHRRDHVTGLRHCIYSSLWYS